MHLFLSVEHCEAWSISCIPWWEKEAIVPNMLDYENEMHISKVIFTENDQMTFIRTKLQNQ